jgi:carboxyl-terminal processing protease
MIGCALLVASGVSEATQVGAPPEGGTIHKAPKSASFVGLGLHLDHQLSADGYAVVRAITPQAGEDTKKALRPGDKIARVDGKPTRNASISQIVKLLRGEEGKSVRLTLLRAGAKKPVDVSVKRRMIYAVGEGPGGEK